MTQVPQTTYVVGHLPGLPAHTITSSPPLWKQGGDAKALRDCPDLAQNPLLFSMSMDHPNTPFFSNTHLRFSGDLSFQTMKTVLGAFRHVRDGALVSDEFAVSKGHTQMERVVRDAFSAILQQPSLRILSFQPNRPAYIDLLPSAFKASLENLYRSCGAPLPQPLTDGIALPFAQAMILRATKSEREFFGVFSRALARCAAYTVYHVRGKQGDEPVFADLVRMGLSLGHVESSGARYLGFSGFDAALTEILAQAIRIKALASRNLLNRENGALDSSWPPHVVLFAALLNDLAEFKNLTRHGVLRYSLKCYLTGETAIFDNLLAYLGVDDLVALSRVTEDKESVIAFLKNTETGRKIYEAAGSPEAFKEMVTKKLMPAIEVVASI